MINANTGAKQDSKFAPRKSSRQSGVNDADDHPATPRYRHLAIGDLTHLVLDPLLRDRVAIASPAKPDGTAAEPDVAGIAIWASVSEAVDAKIREQITAGVFPVRLRADDWTSGTINWLLDVMAPSAQLATTVVMNFQQLTNNTQLHLHPVVSRLLDPEVLKKLKSKSVRDDAD